MQNNQNNALGIEYSYYTSETSNLTSHPGLLNNDASQNKNYEQ